MLGVVVGSSLASVASETMITSETGVRVHIQYQGPRALADVLGAARVSLLTPDAVPGGYGYGYGYLDPQDLTSWLPYAYGYGYGYGYGPGGWLPGLGALPVDPLAVIPVPTGTYRLLGWIDLNANNQRDDTPSGTPPTPMTNGPEPYAYGLNRLGEVTFNVREGEVLDVYVIVREASATVRGHVLDGATPVADTTVTLTPWSLPGAPAVTTTDAAGFYQFTGVPAGYWYPLAYNVTATSGDRSVGRATLVGPGDAVTTLDPLALPEGTRFTHVEAAPVDADNDGLYDHIRMNGTLVTQGGARYAILQASVRGALSLDAIAHKSALPAFYEGEQDFEILVPGHPVRTSGVDPVAFDVLLLNAAPTPGEPNLFAHASGTFAGGAASQYAPPPVHIRTPLRMERHDADGDGLTDLVYVNATVDFTGSPFVTFVAGASNVTLGLETRLHQAVGFLPGETYTGTGVDVSLTFDGSSIFASNMGFDRVHL